MTTRLFLVRHGETESNRKGLALGRSDPPLNERGLEQAEALGSALCTERFAAVYSSPLSRARDTARPIAEGCGVEVTVDDSLIEMDVGALDGLDFASVRERYPDFIEKWLSVDGPSEAMPGGESLRAVQERGAAFLDRVADEHESESVCAVTHNFVILALLATVLGMELSSFRRLRQGVAAVSVLEREGGVWRVLKMNDTCHLDRLTG